MRASRFCSSDHGYPRGVTLPTLPWFAQIALLAQGVKISVTMLIKCNNNPNPHRYMVSSSSGTGKMATDNTSVHHKRTVKDVQDLRPGSLSLELL